MTLLINYLFTTCYTIYSIVIVFIGYILYADLFSGDFINRVIDELYRQIGQLKVENEWLKALGQNKSFQQRANLLGINRVYRYEPLSQPLQTTECFFTQTALLSL